MKNFLSLNSKFNIFNLLGILIIVFGIYNYHHTSSMLIPIIFIAQLVGFAPVTYNSILNYKKTRKIDSQLKLTLFMFISLVLVVILNLIDF